MNSPLLSLFFSIALIFPYWAQDELREKLNSLEIINHKADPTYLSSVENILMLYADLDLLFTQRYGCKVFVLDASEEDPVCEVVSFNPDYEYGVLFLPLSILEEFHQKKKLVEQVEQYCMYSQALLGSDNYNGLDKISPILFNKCENTVNLEDHGIVIPLSADKTAVYEYLDKLENYFENDSFEIAVLIYLDNEDYIRDIWFEISNNEELITLPLCGLKRAHDSGQMEEELNRVFDHLKKLNKKE